MFVDKIWYICSCNKTSSGQTRSAELNCKQDSPLAYVVIVPTSIYLHLHIQMLKILDNLLPPKIVLLN